MPTKPDHPTADPRYRRIWRIVRDIPPGRVTSYGDIARRAGLPGRARLVGYALRIASAELDLPWHRVINAQGRIAQPRDGEGYREQRRRLLAEGIRFDAGGRVDLKRHGWGMSLDELLWGPE